MNKEIKEILIKDFNEILVKEFCTDWKEKRLYIELLVNSTPFSNLLDYITNLQEENNKLKNLEYKFFDCSGDEESFTLNDYLELGNKVYDLQEENERIKKMNMHEHKYGSDMEGKYLIEKAKNDKAIEYIEEQYKWIEESDERWQPVLDIKKLLNILRGDKE